MSLYTLSQKAAIIWQASTEGRQAARDGRFIKASICGNLLMRVAISAPTASLRKVALCASLEINQILSNQRGKQA